MTASIPQAKAPGAPGLVGQLARRPGRPIATRIPGFVGALAFAVALAACGGGSNVETLPVTPPPDGTVTACDSLTAGGAGYALGVCASSAAAVFQPVEAGVAPVDSPRSYTLTLGLPATLPSGLSGATEFTEADATPFGTRDVIGALRGTAYEKPLGAAPPFTALTSFRTVWADLRAFKSFPTHTFSYSAFGIWEKFAEMTADDGYLGVWYAPFLAAPGIVDNGWSSVARVYSGWAAGILSPLQAPGDLRQGVSTYGFSAKVTIVVDGDGRIDASQSFVYDLVLSFPSTTPEPTQVQVQVGPMALGQSVSDVPDEALSGELSGPGIEEAVFEASYFGDSTLPAQEIAGRLRFRIAGSAVGAASDVLGVAAFGVH